MNRIWHLIKSKCREFNENKKKITRKGIKVKKIQIKLDEFVTENEKVV